jgi:hypothetical protein
MKTILSIAALVSLLAWPALAQDRVDFTKLPGYFDFGDIVDFSDGEELVEIDIAQPMLGLIARVVEYEDEALAELLLNVDHVGVNVFSYHPDDFDALLGDMEKMAKKLEGDGWDSIVRVRGRDENANIFVKLAHGDGDAEEPDVALTGVTILVIEDDEAVFANVVGNFGYEEIARLGDHFDIPHLEDMDRDRRRDRRRDRDGE